MKTAVFSFLFCLLPVAGQAQVYDIEGTATVHYTGTIESSVGAGTYFTKQGGWGTKISFRSFATDNTETTGFEMNRESGIVVIPPGLEGNVPPDLKKTSNVQSVGTKTKQRELTLGITRSITDLTFYLEGGATLTRNYQSAAVSGETLFRKHPEGYRMLHPTAEVGAAVWLFEHVSVQAGYNYTTGELPVNHEIVFGIGYTDFPNSWELF
jgi:hypothetical protein